MIPRHALREPMKAVILAGGEGTRLRPLTFALPKPVVPVLDRPLMRHQLELLTQAGVNEVVFSLAYRPEAVQAVLGTGDGLRRIHYAIEGTPLGTGGAVRNAQSYLDSTTIVFNGDVLANVDLAAVIAQHRAAQASATLVLTPVENPAAYGLVEMDATGRVQRFIEKPEAAQITTNTINAGIYILETSTLALMPSGVKYSIERGFFPSLLARGDRVMGYIHRGYWIDIGTPEKYLQVHRDILRGRFSVSIYGRQVSGGWIHATALVDPAARLEAPFYIGPGCRIAAGAIIGPDAVLTSDVAVRQQARIEDSVLWAGCEVEEGALVEGALLGPSVRIGRRASAGRGALLGEKSIVSEFSRTS